MSSIEKRIEILEKKVAALEQQLTEQPENIKETLGTELTPNLVLSFGDIQAP